MNTKLIAIDVDGTLLDDDRRVSAENIQAIQSATNAGIQVVLATGRKRSSCLSILEQLGLSAPGLFVNGLHVADADGVLVKGWYLSAEIVERVNRFMLDAGYGVTGYGVDSIYTEQLNAYTQSGHPLAVPELAPSLAALPLHLLITHGDYAELAPLRVRLEALLAGKAQVVMSSPRMLEVLPLIGSKGVGLDWLAGEWGLSAENIVAIGNEENDLEMLNYAGLGVAVGNSSQLVLDSADLVVASNNESGVAEAIWQLL